MNKISIKDISRSLIFMMAFALIFVFLARGFAVSSSSSEDGMESRITTAYRGEARNSLDVIFTGNSDIYRGVSPVDLYDRTGITSAVSGRPNNSLKMIVKDIGYTQVPGSQGDRARNGLSVFRKESVFYKEAGCRAVADAFCKAQKRRSGS